MALQPKYTQEEFEQKHKAKMKKESRRRRKKTLLLLLLLSVISVGVFVGRDLFRPTMVKFQETLVDMGFETNFIEYSSDELREKMKSEMEKDVLHYNALVIIDGDPETQTGFIFGNYEKNGEVQQNKAIALENIKYEKTRIALEYAKRIMEKDQSLTTQQALDRVNSNVVQKEYMDFLRTKVVSLATMQEKTAELETVSYRLADESQLITMIDTLMDVPKSSKYYVSYAVYLKEDNKPLQELLKLYETRLIRVGEKAYSEDLLIDLPNGEYETYVVQTKYDMVTKENVGSQQVVSSLKVAK